MSMHIYLIVTEDNTEAFVYSNLQKAKEKEEELTNPKIYEWMALWCRPIDYQNDGKLTDLSSVWLQLEKAYDQGNWNTRAKYPKDRIDDIKLTHQEYYIV